MKVLVTGGAGFIGSHLVRGLLEDGHSVRVIDNLSTGQLWRLEPIMAAIDFLHADICDSTAVMGAVEGVEGVLHQAAMPSVSRSIEDPVGSTRTNVIGTVELLNACRTAGVQRMVYAASSSAYGDAPDLPKVETICPKPMSPYAVSKLSAEQFCQVFAGLGFVETVCLRYFNVFGPMQDPSSQYAAVIPRFIQAILQDGPVPVEGDGTQSRDFTYISNVVQANLKALRADGVSGQVLNIGCGQRYDLNTLIRFLGEIIGCEPAVDFLPPRQGDVPHSLADISKAKTLIDYNPTIDFRTGLEQTVDWFRQQLSSDA
jgi:nucleoside-diphosphate-sugar epimerase